MRRIRKEATKVWHNPELNTFARRGGGNGGIARQSETSADEKRTVSAHRAALEALFAPKRDPEAPVEEAKGTRASRDSTPPKTAGRIVLPAAPQSDPRTGERQKLLGKLLRAEGRPAVSKCADDFLRAGFTFPEEQDVYLKLLEHANEDHVRTALEVLGTLLAGELPQRRAVLESRLRRIEQFAEEPSTRDAAARLRRRVSGRGDAPCAPASSEGAASDPRDQKTPPDVQ